MLELLMLERDILFFPGGDFSAGDIYTEFTVCVMIDVSIDISLFFISVFICVLFLLFFFSFLFVYRVYDFHNNNCVTVTCTPLQIYEC